MTETTTTALKARTKKTNRRAAGEGSVFKRADGTWVAQIDMGRDENGKRRLRQFRATTQQAAKARRDEYLKLAKQGQALPDLRKSVESWLTYWLTSVLPGTVKDSTIDAYRYVIEAYIVPKDDPDRPRVRLREVDGLRNKKLAALQPDDVQTWLRNLEALGLSRATIRKAYNVLNKAMRTAVKYRKVSHNVVADVDAPTIKRKRIDRHLSIEQAQALLSQAKGKRFEAMFWIAIESGLREGEVCGLTWPTIDLENGTATVAGTLKRRVGKGLQMDTAKTDSSARTVALTAETVAMLKAIKVGQAKDRMKAATWPEGPDFVFRMEGTQAPVDPRYMLKMCHQFSEAAGIGRQTVHSLRHSCATLQLARGESLDKVSKTLGHKSLQITHDYYSHLSTDVLRSGVDGLGAALRAAD